MIKNILTILATTFHTISLLASEYDVNKISADLLENASVVTRLEEQVFDVKNLTKAQLTYKTAITILSKSGAGHANLSIVYDKFSTISNIKATMYDATGKKVRE